MHNFVYLAQRRSQEFFCERNFGGACPRPPLLAAPLTNCRPQWRMQEFVEGGGSLSPPLFYPFIVLSSLPLKSS